MIKRNAAVWLAMAALVAFTLALTTRAQWPIAAEICIVATAFFAAVMTPAVRRAVQTQSGFLVWAGVVTTFVGIGVLVATLAFPSAISVAWGSGWFCACLLIGIFVILLPRTAAAVDQAVETQKTLQAAGLFGLDRAGPVREATSALFDPIDRMAAYGRVAGPYLGDFCALPLALQLFNHTTAQPAHDLGQSTALLAALLSVVLIGYMILIVAAIRWTRFVVTDREPDWIAVPGHALWGWIWRLFIFGSIFRVTGGLEPWLAERLPGVAPWVPHALSDTAVYAMAILATPFALSLTASALSDSARAVEMRMRVLRTYGRKLYLGSAVVLAPFLVVNWLADVISGHANESPALVASAVGYLLALFLTMTAFSGYLGRIYANAC